MTRVSVCNAFLQHELVLVQLVSITGCHLLASVSSVLMTHGEDSFLSV